MDNFENALESEHIFSNKESALKTIEKLRILANKIFIEIEKISKKYEI